MSQLYFTTFECKCQTFYLYLFLYITSREVSVSTWNGGAEYTVINPAKNFLKIFLIFFQKPRKNACVSFFDVV